jgi:periplasmic protein TonB
MPVTEKLSEGRRGWRRWGFAVVSVVVHAGLLVALVVSTDQEVAAETEERDEEVTYVDVRRFAPPPPPAPPQASAPSTPQPQQQTPQPQTEPQPRPQPRPQPQTPPRASDLVDPVDSLPDEPLGREPVPRATPAPRIEPATGGAAGGTAEGGQAGGVAGGVEGGVEGGRAGGVVGGQGEEVPDPGGTFIAAVVDRQAELRNRGDLPRIMRRLYPSALQDAGVGGRVVVQFVVGSNGRVDMSTVKIMSSSHDGFDSPTREALKEFRFTPARMGDRQVRMLTQLPIVWEVVR